MATTTQSVYLAVQPLTVQFDNQAVENLIDLDIGATKVRMSISADVLTRTSKYLQATIRSAWRGAAQPIALHTVEPEQFGTYSQWLHHGEGVILGPIEANDGTAMSFSALCRLYVLGEYLMDFKFQNCVTEAILQSTRKWNTNPNFGPVGILYAGTPPSSPGRLLMVDLYATYDDCSFTQSGEWPPQVSDFVAELTSAKLRYSTPSRVDQLRLRQLRWGVAFDYYVEKEDFDA